MGKAPASFRPPPPPPPPPPSAPAIPQARRRESAAECAASTCLLCVCCPLAVLWSCVKLPLSVAAAAGRRARDCSCWGGGTRRGRILEASSSFSDHELDWMPPPERRDRRCRV